MTSAIISIAAVISGIATGAAILYGLFHLARKMKNHKVSKLVIATTLFGICTMIYGMIAALLATSSAPILAFILFFALVTINNAFFLFSGHALFLFIDSLVALKLDHWVLRVVVSSAVTYGILHALILWTPTLVGLIIMLAISTIGIWFFLDHFLYEQQALNKCGEIGEIVDFITGFWGFLKDPAKLIDEVNEEMYHGIRFEPENNYDPVENAPYEGETIPDST